MSAPERFGAAIRRAGGWAQLLCDDGPLPFPASIQPRRETGAAATGGVLGFGRADCYTLFAPVGTPGDLLECGGIVVFEDARFHVERTETFRLSGVPVYRWAALRREEGNAHG